ncbi:hypothetical protein AAF712_014490 [Marasmius tenuissimus]|uniref:Uncharacterized protein n=1 Tax=Marasmius tenuissimus TaxID=585030 RepID=A0ABR2ZC71_9AGAR
MSRQEQGSNEDCRHNLAGEGQEDENMETKEEKTKQNKENKMQQRIENTNNGENINVDHLKQKILKISAEVAKKEAELQRKIVELEAKSSEKSEEIYKLREQLLRKELAEEVQQNYQEKEEE